MTKPKYRALPVRGQRDLDHGRTGRHRILVLPAPRNQHPVRRINLPILAHGHMLAIDVDAILPARSWIELCSNAHPGNELIRLGEIGEDGRGGGADPLCDLNRCATLDQLFDLFLSSASASRRRRSTFRAHIPHRYASSGRNASLFAL